MRRYKIRTKVEPKVRKNADGKLRERFESLRDEAKRAWIRQQPCAIAGPQCRYFRTAEGFVSDPEHVENKSRGLGDASLIPLCRKHHDERHTFGPKSFEREHKVKFALLVGEYQLKWEQAQGVSI